MLAFLKKKNPIETPPPPGEWIPWSVMMKYAFFIVACTLKIRVGCFQKEQDKLFPNINLARLR